MPWGGAAVAVGADGKLLFATGVAPTFNEDGDLCLMRFNSNGTLDASFGTAGSGATVTDLAASLDQYVQDSAMQPDGKLIVIGAPRTASANWLVRRLNPDGSPDLSFGTAGLVEVDFGGYGDTKWVCERLMEQARERGLPVVVYRPGVLSGDSRTGIGNTRDMIWNLIRACVQMGTTPTGDKPLDIVPVDYVAAGIVRLSLTEGAAGPVYHFANSNPPEFRVCFEFLHRYGYRLEWVPSDQWDASVVEAASGQRCSRPDDRPSRAAATPPHPHDR